MYICTHMHKHTSRHTNTYTPHHTHTHTSYICKKKHMFIIFILKETDQQIGIKIKSQDNSLPQNIQTLIWSLNIFHLMLANIIMFFPVFTKDDYNNHSSHFQSIFFSFCTLVKKGSHKSKILQRTDASRQII